MWPPVCRVALIVQLREFVSLFGLLASCPEGRVLLTAVSSDPTYSVTTLLKPSTAGSEIGTGASGPCSPRLSMHNSLAALPR